MKAIARALTVGFALTSLLASSPGFSNPPPWAPAHGWRKKNDPNYEGYAGRKWDKDYGVIEGRCLREAAGAAIGGAIGAAAGSQVGGGTGRKVAIVVGAVLGAAIGAKIGRDLDDADRACIGHALELAGERKSVRWSAGDVGYLLTPVGGFTRGGTPCRHYTLAVSRGKDMQNVKGAACRAGDGTWQVAS